MSAELGTEDNPYPVRSVATRVQAWIDRLGAVWIEGQLTEITVRGSITFMVLRDTSADMSLRANCASELVRSAPVKLAEGVQVLVLAKPQFDPRRGSFALRVRQIRAVGLGELLARIEMLRKVLDAEGLFDPRLKRPIPFLPNMVGLITGRASAAEKDVTTVAAARYPGVRFRIRNTAVQGTSAVAQIVDALAALDADPEIDVIVIARGGGSAEDLLPFSDETLCRAIAACRTPVVSAVGHEPDNPLCDLVADVRAATPTDAAKRIVPDTAAELALVRDLRHRCSRALRNWVTRQGNELTQLRSRPVLSDPMRMVTERDAEVQRLVSASRRDVRRLVAVETDRIGHLSARLTTLGPAATLARGYAVVQRIDGVSEIVRSTGEAPAGTQLRIRVADGAIGAVSTGAEDATR